MSDTNHSDTNHSDMNHPDTHHPSANRGTTHGTTGTRYPSPDAEGARDGRGATGTSYGATGARSSVGRGMGREARRREMERIRSIVHLMDDAFRIPLIGKRFGFDGLIGLIPGLGDLIGAGVAFFIVWRAAAMGAPSGLVRRMGGTVLTDLVVGSIPLVGDVFDLFHKANRRNLRLLEAWMASEASGGYA